MKEILVVGCGLSGVVIARQLALEGYKIHIIEKRDHIGGNVYDYVNKNGIRVHQYGPHLFHTKNEKVFRYLQQFAEWVPYKHQVKAMLKDGRYVTLPVNRETKEIVGEENIVETFYRPYSEKMWAMKLEELNPDILQRVPVRDDDNEFYFPNDPYQAMPKEGYTHLVQNMLRHPNIRVSLQTPFQKSMEEKAFHIFNAMPIDEYYDHCFGELPYRSVKFHTLDLPFPKVLPVATVNFTHRGPHTRVTEWKNIPEHGQNDQCTTLTYEEPCDYKDNNNERFYPVKDLHGINRALYKKYQALPNEKTTFIGRLGLYIYIDMDQAVNAALKIAEQFLQKNKKS